MSEALRLADILEKMPLGECDEQAAAELRRLHALNAELVEALQGMIDCCPETRGTHNPHLAMARAALAKVEANK